MICELIEASNHVCVLHFTVKYLADVPEQTIDVARRDSSASVKVVLTPRNEHSNPTQRKSSVLADGNLVLEQKEKLRTHSDAEEFQGRINVQRHSQRAGSQPVT